MKKRIVLLCLCLIAALFAVVYAVVQKIESQYNEMDYFLRSDLYQLSYVKKENIKDCSFTFDFNDPERKRTPKKSYYWFKEYINEHTEK